MKRNNHTENELFRFSWQRPAHLVWSHTAPLKRGVSVDSSRMPVVRTSEPDMYDWTTDFYGSDLLIEVDDLEWETIEPLKDSDLWTHFAKPNPSREEVFKLAKKYGFLYSCGYEKLDEFSVPYPVQPYYCEAYLEWKR